MLDKMRIYVIFTNNNGSPYPLSEHHYYYYYCYLKIFNGFL